jgi:CheY-like chemotaxis protein
MSQQDQKLIVLLVEDNEDDVHLFKRACAKAGVPLPVNVCRDGTDAIEYLRGTGSYADRTKYPFPKILITDLKMPRSNGLELLKWLREHEHCAIIPVMMFSTSALEQDVAEAYRLGVTAYFQKPSTQDQLVAIVKAAMDFWIWAVLPDLPKKC